MLWQQVLEDKRGLWRSTRAIVISSGLTSLLAMRSRPSRALSEVEGLNFDRPPVCGDRKRALITLSLLNPEDRERI
jgi:hypothetical protein